MVDEQGPSFRDVMREEIVACFIGLCRIFKDNFYGTRVIEFLVVFLKKENIEAVDTFVHGSLKLRPKSSK